MLDFSSAVARTPGNSLCRAISDGELGSPDPERARIQHVAYVDALEEAGLAVTLLPPLEAFPDSVFVEDTAVLLDEAVVLCHPGAGSRRGEVGAMQRDLRALDFEMEAIRPPGTLDGGDVLRVGRRFFVGISKRTNQKGFQQFSTIVSRYGFSAVAVPVQAGLHLKSHVSLVDRNTLLLTPGMAQETAFSGFCHLVLPQSEAYAANCLALNGVVLVAAGFPATREMLSRAGLHVRELDVSEFRRADGGLSCLSLRF